MVFDRTPEEIPPKPDAGPAAVDTRAKVRIRFRKGDDLRFLSHHDLMRTFERMLRRGKIPFYSTRGFHPKPRLIFALSLPLGVVGVEEVVELELSRPVATEEIFAALAAQAPPGLTIHSVCPIDRKAGAQVCRLCYRAPLPTDLIACARAHAAELLAAESFRVERAGPPVRTIELRPSLSDLRVIESDEGAALEIELCPTPAGTARPEEVLRFLQLERLLDSGAVLERSRLELEDETSLPPRVPDVISTGSGTHLAGATPVAEGIA